MVTMHDKDSFEYKLMLARKRRMAVSNYLLSEDLDEYGEYSHKNLTRLIEKIDAEIKYLKPICIERYRNKV
jgi:ribosomal protein S15P/S13E